MKQMLDLLQYPHAVEANITISDKLLTGVLKTYVKLALLQDISCTIGKSTLEIQLAVGVLKFAKHFTIEVEIEDLVIVENQCLLTLKVKSKSLSVVTSVLNLLGKSFVSFIKFQQDRLYVDLSQQKESFLIKQPIALRNELKQVRISKPLLTPHHLCLTISKE